MTDPNRRIRCELCRKCMSLVPGSGRYIPFEVEIYLDYRGNEKALYYYECPNGHAYAWFIPAYGKEKELVIKRHFNRQLDEILP